MKKAPFVLLFWVFAISAFAAEVQPASSHSEIIAALKETSIPSVLVCEENQEAFAGLEREIEELNNSKNCYNINSEEEIHFTRGQQILCVRYSKANLKRRLDAELNVPCY